MWYAIDFEASVFGRLVWAMSPAKFGRFAIE